MTLHALAAQLTERRVPTPTRWPEWRSTTRQRQRLLEAYLAEVIDLACLSGPLLHQLIEHHLLRQT